MRFVIALVFLVAIFACVFTFGAVVRAFETVGPAGIQNPEELLVKFGEALHGHAFATVVATLALLSMMVNAFMQRALVKGIAIVFFTLIAGFLAALAVLDVGSIWSQAQSATPQPRDESGAGPMYHHASSPFARMSLPEISPHTVREVLRMASMRVTTSLSLLGLGVALTLIGGRAKPPAIPSPS
jgi:hypothetical protein